MGTKPRRTSHRSIMPRSNAALQKENNAFKKQIAEMQHSLALEKGEKEAAQRDLAAALRPEPQVCSKKFTQRFFKKAFQEGIQVYPLGREEKPKQQKKSEAAADVDPAKKGEAAAAVDPAIGHDEAEVEVLTSTNRKLADFLCYQPKMFPPEDMHSPGYMARVEDELIKLLDVFATVYEQPDVSSMLLAIMDVFDAGEEFEDDKAFIKYFCDQQACMRRAYRTHMRKSKDPSSAMVFKLKVADNKVAATIEEHFKQNPVKKPHSVFPSMHPPVPEDVPMHDGVDNLDEEQEEKQEETPSKRRRLGGDDNVPSTPGTP